MTNTGKIEEFLKREQGVFCDDCLSELTHISPRQQVNQKCREHPELFETHQMLRCSKCGKVKTTRCLRESNTLNWDDLKKAKLHLDAFIASQGGEDA